MTATALATPILRDLHDFIAWLEPQKAKFEFVDGRLVAMAGGSLRHGTIQANLMRELGVQLRGGPCRPYTADTLLSTDGHGRRGRFPDASVTCSPERAEHWITRPVALFEVLSPDSERVDRGEKWLEYQTIPSLQHYVLIAQDSVRVEHYRRQGDEWVYRELADIDGALALDPSGIVLPLADLYEGVELPEPAEPGGVPL